LVVSFFLHGKHIEHCFSGSDAAARANNTGWYWQTRVGKDSIDFCVRYVKLYLREVSKTRKSTWRDFGGKRLATLIFRQLGCVDMSTWKVPDGVVLTWKLYGMYLRMCRSGLIMCLNGRMHQHVGLARQVLATAGRCKRRPPRVQEVLIQLQTSRIVHFERTPLAPRQERTVLQVP
jgi:hypothetical protein